MPSVRPALGRTANRLLAPLGLKLVPRADRARATAAAALAQLAARGVAPRTVLDVGAAYGDWSAAAAAVWPRARWVLVEPLAEYAGSLDARVQGLGDAIHVAVAAGADEGEVELRVHPDLVGSSTRPEREESGSELRRVPRRRLDTIVRDVAAEPPFLLKLDVQGGELDALAGAGETLAGCDAVVLEALLFEFYVGGPQLADLVAALRERGFALYDLVDLSYRPLDGALAQVDAVFVRDDGPLRADHRYATPEQRRKLDAALRPAP